ncbi:hypothetical protein P3T76_001847 [Phytophthora citrophthora]|uniref:CCHC-type domain-containing protein n=1 Tax=Phytophthora citrophthora TaxID=4793 RepID=A0AAD9GX98_9STRA|nr:hypothetical protein P3T76_001847 [Phytophthora citrophthora]
MREAAETVGHQGRQIEDLKEEVLSPRGQSRWGWFARSAGQGGRERDGDEPMVDGDASENRNEPTITVATGSNMPVPPVYRGSTKKEKKAFMDSYLIYKRRVTALNQGAYGRVFVMPLSACIEHRTLTRICMYELGKPESEITEEDWKAYFLAARRPEVQDHARLAQAMRSLSMNTTLPDAESRVIKLVTDFNEILDAQNMDDFPLEEPKMAVEFLCAALKPPVLKQTVITELKRTMHKSTKKSVKVFLDWLKSRVSAFLIFESAIQRTTGADGSQPHQQSKPSNAPRNNARFQSPRAGAAAVSPGPKPSSVGSGPNSAGTKLQGAKKSSTPGQPRKCFKCGDLTHGVFQCPLASATEAKELYDKNRKAPKPVGAVVLVPDQPVQTMPEDSAGQKTGSLACRVNGLLAAWAKPDSGAEVSVVTPHLLQELRAKGQWLQCRDLQQWESIKGIAAAPMVIKQEVKLDLRFDTINGGLTLKNLTCWVVSDGLSPGMGDILLSEGVMERLGYNAQALLDQARSIRDVYDMDEDVAPPGVRSVLVYAAATTIHPEPTPEEKEL